MSAPSGHGAPETGPGAPPSPPAKPAPQHAVIRWARPGRFLRDLNILALLIVIAAGAALLLLPGSDDGLLGLPALNPGEDAPRTIKSPREFWIADPETTDRLRQEVMARVLPIYDLATSRGADAKGRIEAAFAADASLRAVDAGATVADPLELHRARAQQFQRALGTSLDDESLLPLIKAPVPDELRDAAIMISQTIHESRIVEDRALLKLQAPAGIQLRLIDPQRTEIREETVYDYKNIASIDQARARVDELVADQLKRLPVEQRRAVAMIVKRLLVPNLVPNRTETERRIEQAARAVKTVIVPIKQGETVLRAGERVTERHLFILQGIEKELRAQSRVQASAGSALLIVVLVVLLYRFLSRSKEGFEPSHRDLAFLASAYLFMLLLTWLGFKATLSLSEAFPLVASASYRLLFPVAAGALLVRFVVGAEVAAALVPLVALTAGWMMGPSLGFTAYAICGSFAAISVRDSDRPRTALFVAGLRAAGAQAVVVVALALLESRISPAETTAEICAAILSGLLASLIAALLVPAVEAIFGYTTELKLTELANLNHPLLRELLVEAPGTYHHSILVGTLAEAGARVIGANELLARVGGYYHDIGKIKNPRAFEENVAASPFVSASPVDDAREIRAHVADGLELAAKHRLGQPLLEIIAQHHGTTVVRNAHQRALDLAPAGGAQPALTDFAYPGPRPIMREAALVMLADFVEVATRDLAAEVALDVADVEGAVRKAVDETIDAGQCDLSALTLRDLQAIIREFTSVLEDRLIRRGRPTLSTMPRPQAAKLVQRSPLPGELN